MRTIGCVFLRASELFVRLNMRWRVDSVTHQHCRYGSSFLENRQSVSIIEKRLYLDPVMQLLLVQQPSKRPMKSYPKESFLLDQQQDRILKARWYERREVKRLTSRSKTKAIQKTLKIPQDSVPGYAKSLVSVGVMRCRRLNFVLGYI